MPSSSNTGNKGGRRSRQNKGGSRRQTGSLTSSLSADGSGKPDTRLFGNDHNHGSGALRTAMLKFSNAGPFPPFRYYNMPYVCKFLLTSVDAGTTLGTQVTFRLNSLFDPEKSASGHQPYGFDALSLAYNRYKVLACHVKITLTDPSGDGLVFCWCIFNPTEASNTIAGSSHEAITERQQAGCAFINNTGSQVKSISMGVPIHLASGLTRLQFDADPDNFTAGVAGNPGSEVVLAMAIATNTATTPASTITCSVDLTFNAMLYQRKTMSQS